MVLPEAEKEWGQRAAASLKAEMKKDEVIHAELVKHGRPGRSIFSGSF
jgi:hypothetical protein